LVRAFALRLSQSRLWRHLFLLAASLAAIVIVGYHFGTFDQAIHIPFLKKYVDPSLFPNDPFFALRFEHFSYFWFVFQPLYWLDLQLHPMGLPVVLMWGMFGVHLLATYLTFYAIWSLADELFANPVTNVLAVAAFVIPHIGFAGFPVIEFSLLNRTFVLPFLLLALILYLRRRYVWAFVLMGVMYNLHVISVNFALAMVLSACLFEFRQVGWRKLAAGMALFVLCALPVLLWKAGSSPVDLTPRYAWFDTISKGTLYSLFFLIAPYGYILAITLCGASALAMFFVARARRPSPRHDRTLTLFVVAVIIILAVEGVTAEWLPLTILVQSQIIRAGLFALIFGYVYFANYIVTRWEAGELSRVDGTILTAAFVGMPLPLITVLVLPLQRFIASPRWRAVVTAVAVPAALAVAVILTAPFHLLAPGLHIFGPQTPWVDAQLWAKEHTAKDAVFITPPQIWSFYDSEWRVFSERSTVVTHSELLEAAFAPAYLDDRAGPDGRVNYGWRTRLADLAPGALEKFQGNFFDNQQIIAGAFYGLSTDQLRAAADKYGASYLVVEKPHLRDLTACYANSQYVVYALTPAAAAAAHCQP
jgi:hypothetical protein